MEHFQGQGSITRTSKNKFGKAIWYNTVFKTPAVFCQIMFCLAHYHLCLLTANVFNAYFIDKYILFYSIIEKGEEQCGHLIEAHKECMRALGFKI